MAWYDAGTVKVTLNSATVTGTGTQWLAGARQGEAFVAPDGRLYEVLNIASDTSLTLTKPYRGATASAQQYALAPMQGYVKELADRASELIPVLSDIGTAAKGTLTTSDQDASTGRVLKVGDFGLGKTAGVNADPVVLNNTLNGFYRSGSGASYGKPVNQSGDGYIKFGWSGSFATFLYGSPAANGLWFQHLNNGVATGWKEIMAVGRFGLGGEVEPISNTTYNRGFTRFVGWPSANRPEIPGSTLPAWCVGINLAYSPTRTALLILNTVTGEVSSISNPDGTWRSLRKMVDTQNMVGDVSAGAVVQSGMNANGHWARFADGTQICYGSMSFAGNGWQGKSWQYPMGFISNPSVTASGCGGNGGWAAAPVLDIWTASVIFRKMDGAVDNDNYANFSLVAIGRWKE